MRTSSDTCENPSAARNLLSSTGHGSSDSNTARTTSAHARLPIQCPEPSSLIANPHPPARAVAPLSLRPKQIDPVPEITITPGPDPNAACRAMTLSPTTLISPDTISPRMLFSLSAYTDAPATPMHVLAMLCGSAPAFVQARCTA